MPKGSTDDFPEQGQGGGKSGIWHLRVGDDGERARIRFLTDSDEFFYSWFHRLEAGGKYQGEKICVKYEYDQECDLCDAGVKSTFLWLAWVYVFHQDFNTNKQGRKTTQVGKRTVYREEINETRLMKYAGSYKNAIKMAIDEADEKGDGLLDYVYDWIRAGAKGETRLQYTLRAIEKAPFPTAFAELLSNLPDLEDMATGKAGGQTSTKTAAPAAGAFDDAPITDNAYAEDEGPEATAEEEAEVSGSSDLF